MSTRHSSHSGVHRLADLFPTPDPSDRLVVANAQTAEAYVPPADSGDARTPAHPGVAPNPSPDA